MEIAARVRTSVARGVRIEDPDLAALKSALRAAIVMPAVFAFADQVIGQPQTTIFSAFGSFAILVLADFSGRPRARLVAYLSLAAAGAALISIGTLCSRSTLLATAVMAVVGFAILFSGVFHGYLAAGAFPALLSFIIAVNIPAPPSAIPQRLEGWALACAAGISAVMLLWPPRPRPQLHAATARACQALADLLDAELTREPSLARRRASAAREAVADARRRFVAMPHRPGGPPEALGFLVDELDWLQSLVVPPAEDAERQVGLRREEHREALAASVAALRASAARLAGENVSPDLERLDRARRRVVEALVREVAELPNGWADSEVLSAVEPSFRMRELTYAVWNIAARALVATGSQAPELDPSPPRTFTRRSLLRLARQHARPRSVWFQNSVRGAAALAISVYVAQRASVQHAFWVVLGTLSVLRSNALVTGSTIISALVGTAVGIVIGVGLILALGVNEPVLWAALPFAVLLAAYAPRAISFAAGQAGFTVVLVILFNIIQPTGWTVGLVRVEDVLIGFAISLGVGLLFWPRGAGSLLRESLAESFARNADYLAAAVRALAPRHDLTTADAMVAVDRARDAARAASHRLDDVYRQFLTERRAHRLDLESVGTLVAGAVRVRLAAHSLLGVARAGPAPRPWPGCADAVDGDVEALRAWLVALGGAIERSIAPPPPQRDDPKGDRRALQCLREALAERAASRIHTAICLIIAGRHINNLQQGEADLARAAARLAGGSPQAEADGAQPPTGAVLHKAPGAPPRAHRH